MPKAIVPDVIELPMVILGVGMGFVARARFAIQDITTAHVSFLLYDKGNSELTYAATTADDVITIVPESGDVPNYALIQVPSSLIPNIAVEGRESHWAIDVSVDAETDPFIRMQGVVTWNKKGGPIND